MLYCPACAAESKSGEVWISQDLWGLQPQDRSESLHHKWEDAWQNGGDTYSALKICFKKPFLQAGMFKLVNSTMQVRQRRLLHCTILMRLTLPVFFVGAGVSIRGFDVAAAVL